MLSKLISLAKSLLAGTITDIVYCVKCRAQRRAKRVAEMPTRRGSVRLSGECRECGAATSSYVTASRPGDMG